MLHSSSTNRGASWVIHSLMAATLLLFGCSKTESSHGHGATRPRTDGPTTPQSARTQQTRTTTEAKQTDRPPDSKAQAPVLPPVQGKVEDSAYRVFMAGRPAGTARSTRITGKDRIRSTDRLDLSVPRGGQEVSMSMVQVFDESPDGRPISFSIRLKQAGTVLESTGRYENKAMVVTDASGTRKVPYDPKWLFPAAADRLMRKKGFAKGTHGTLFLFVPELGMTGRKVSWEVTGDKTIQWKGRRVSCHILVTKPEGLPAERACIRNDGVAYERVMHLGSVELRLALETYRTFETTTGTARP